ncbi:MAG: HDIG domain-containing protein [Fibromonadaceae bacterium]|jgi:putative nucleotidyltransferase with HDIG domain|nr:HDIG domain-containing protein [Fibromonadaceae bacterium]
MMAVLFLLPSEDIAQKFELPIVGQNSPRSIYAQVSFEVPKTTQELEEDIKRAKDRVHPIFEYNEDATRNLMEKFEQLVSQIEKYNELQKEISGEASVDKEKITVAGDLYQSIIRQISSTALKQLTQNKASIDTLKNIFHLILSQGVSNTLIAEKNRDVNVFEEMYNANAVNHILYSRGDVLLIKNGKDSVVDVSSVRPKEFLIDHALTARKNSFSSNVGISSAFYEVLYVFTAPNIFYLDKETERRRNEAAAQVNTSKGMVPRGMEIVSQGSVVTKEVLEKLEAMQIALQKDSAMFFNTANYGQYLLFLFVASILCFYLWYFRIDRNIQPLQMWAICIIALTQVILFRLVHSFFLTPMQSEHLNPVWFYPFSFAPILISVLFPLRTAAAIVTWSSVLFGIFAGYDLTLAINAYIISFAMAFIVNRIRYRVKFMQALFVGLAIFSLSLVIILLLRNSMSLINYGQNFLLGAANLLICVTFTSVFCSVFERVFKITTNLKLMELSDFNHPLLRFLSEYAPGSFHHCIQVGNLGEIAGERIRANTLLIRVMALYHDVGKIMRPEFFTENQRFGYNPHDNLSPCDSIKVLRSHVERGMEYAEEYKLPDKVSAGIREHHGNTAAYFFYNKAKEMYPDKEIKFSDFCYKGSIPQSKEAAVLMLADSIEAISRSMQNAKPDELSNMIQKTIEDKMFEEQLNDSGLTIGDIKELGDGFLQGLEGSTHSRVRYTTGSIFLKGNEKRK